MSIVHKNIAYKEDFGYSFPADSDKPVYPTDEAAQLEALSSDPQLREYAESRKRRADRLTPLYHFTTPTGQLNDPNGPCFWNGRWHLFYQHIVHFPDGERTIYWGHTASRDLVHWVDLPDAIYPNPEKECWSGATCVEDGAVTALYYGFAAHGGVYSARSRDPLLLNWNKLYRDPVIPRLDDDPTVSCPYSVYDPCIWKKGDYYYALTGCREIDPDCGVCHRIEYLFRSENAVDWEYLHPFFADDRFSEPYDDGACPYFIPFAGKYLFAHYSHARGPRYLVGSYDKENDLFHPQFGSKFSLSRSNSLGAPAIVPDGGDGAYLFCACPVGYPGSVMSMPYHLTLDGNEMCYAPVDAITSLRIPGSHIHRENVELRAGVETVIPEIATNCAEIVARFAPEDVPALEMKVLRSPDDAEYVKISFYRNRGANIHRDNPQSVLAMDCGHSTLRADSEKFGYFIPAPDVEEFELKPGEGLELRIFLDKTIVEVFANGHTLISKRVTPRRDDSLGLTVTALGGSSKLLSLDAYEMSGIDYSDLGRL